MPPPQLANPMTDTIVTEDNQAYGRGTRRAEINIVTEDEECTTYMNSAGAPIQPQPSTIGV